MPLYDYRCKKCHKQEKDVFHKIDVEAAPWCCGQRMVKDLSNCNKKDWFEPHWNENIDVKPVFVESKQHYKRLCKEKGLVARCLM